ncbi:hypothetical protein ACFPRL_32040 [Pseudoclavibacter helvolus]
MADVHRDAVGGFRYVPKRPVRLRWRMTEVRVGRVHGHACWKRD